MNKRIIGIDLAVSAKHKAVVLDPARGWCRPSGSCLAVD